MSERKVLLLLLGVLFFHFTVGQSKSHIAFKPGEVVNYKAFYNWNFVWIHAGDVAFKVNDNDYKEKDTYHFEAIGKTLKSYDWFYKVRDYFQTYVDKENFVPVFYERNTREGKYRVHNKYYFRYPENYVFTQTENSNKPYEEDLLKLSRPVFDVLSAIYYSRNIEYDSLNTGDKIPLPMIIDNEIFDLYIRYLGKERVKVKDQGEFNCIKFSAMLVEGTIFDKGEHLTVWVTDDKNRIPVIVEAKILIGSVKAIFKSAENLKYPSPLL